jgi:hypothetical protein
LKQLGLSGQRLPSSFINSFQTVAHSPKKDWASWPRGLDRTMAAAMGQDGSGRPASKQPTTVEMGQSRTVTLLIFPDFVDATEGGVRVQQLEPCERRQTGIVARYRYLSFSVCHFKNTISPTSIEMPLKAHALRTSVLCGRPATQYSASFSGGPKNTTHRKRHRSQPPDEVIMQPVPCASRRSLP